MKWKKISMLLIITNCITLSLFFFVRNVPKHDIWIDILLEGKSENWLIENYQLSYKDGQLQFGRGKVSYQSEDITTIDDVELIVYYDEQRKNKLHESKIESWDNLSNSIILGGGGSGPKKQLEFENSLYVEINWEVDNQSMSDILILEPI